MRRVEEVVQNVENTKRGNGGEFCDVWEKPSDTTRGCKVHLGIYVKVGVGNGWAEWSMH